MWNKEKWSCEKVASVSSGLIIGVSTAVGVLVASVIAALIYYYCCRLNGVAADDERNSNCSIEQSGQRFKTEERDKE